MPLSDLESSFLNQIVGQFNKLFSAMVRNGKIMPTTRSKMDPIYNQFMLVFKDKARHQHQFTEVVEELLNSHHQLIGILTNLHPDELSEAIRNMQSEYVVRPTKDYQRVAEANFLRKIKTIEPSYQHTPALEVVDLQHAYSETDIASLQAASLQAANCYEDYLRIGFKTLILFAELEIKKHNQFIEKMRVNDKLAHVVIRKFGISGQKVLNIYGNAPFRSGNKNLYSIQTPSGAQCLIGIRVMGNSINYCCYPMAELDQSSESWITYQPMFLQHIYRNQNNFVARITGMHLTIPKTPNKLSLSPLSKARTGTQYVYHGSHTSIDCQHASLHQGQRMRGFFRVQLRPRVEPAQDCSESAKFFLRCGRPILTPLRDDSNALPKNALTKLTTVLKREKNDGWLLKEGQPLQEEHKFLQALMESHLFKAGQSVITEIAMIGKYLQLHKQIDLTTPDDEVCEAYKALSEILEENPNFLNETQAALSIFEQDDVVRLSPTPTKLRPPEGSLSQEAIPALQL